MSVYLVAIGPASNDPRLVEYGRRAGDLLARYGAVRLAGGPLGALEGNVSADRGIILAFPDQGALEAFWSCADYEALKPLRAGLDFRIFSLPGT